MGNRPYLNYLNCRSFFGWMLFVVVSLVLLIDRDFAEAAPAAKGGKSGSSSNHVDCNKQQVKLNQLKFAGQNFQSSDFYCVKAQNDEQARNICSPAGYKYLNPGNPDYHSGGNTSYGTMESNNLQFYFCYKGPSKEQLCNQAKTTVNSTYTWKKAGNAIHKDGQCQCDADGKANTPLQDCSKADPVPEVAKKVNDIQCTGDGVIINADGNCDCQSGYTKKPSPPSSDTNKLICEKSTTAKDAPQVSQSEISKAMQECVDKYKQQASLCAEKSKAASKKCDQNNSENEQIAKSIRDTNEIANAFQERGQQLGQVQTCFKAGLVSNTGSAYLNSLKKDCNGIIESCSDECSDKVMNDQEQACFALTKTEAASENTDAEAAPKTAAQEKDQEYFNQQKETIRKDFQDGINKCKIAEKNRSLIDQSLSALSGALNSALNCSCQLSANKSAGCSSTDMDCSNPLNPGCQDLNAVNVCTFGSTAYNAAACACVQTPKAKGCPEYLEKNNMNSGFAGADIKGLTNGPPSGGFTSTPTSGGGDDSSVDLGGGHADVATPVAKSNATGANFLAGGGGGAGGGASAPAGGSDGGQGGQGGGGEGPAEQKPLGVFGSLKSIVGSVFGGSNNKGSAGGNSGRGGPNANMDKFRPGLRGVASSGLGGRSGNIFELIKRQYIQQDSSAYIQGP